MNLAELKSLLTEHSQRHFRIALPDGGTVPVSFHVTEVGRLHKTFLDCGGTLRETPSASSRFGSARITTTASKPVKWRPFS